MAEEGLVLGLVWFAVDVTRVRSSPQELYDAGVKRKGTDVPKWISIMTERSFPHLQKGSRELFEFSFGRWHGWAGGRWNQAAIHSGPVMWHPSWSHDTLPPIPPSEPNIDPRGELNPPRLYLLFPLKRGRGYRPQKLVPN